MVKLKARAALRGNEDSSRGRLKSGCSMCFLPGIQILLSLVSLQAWCLTNMNMNAAFYRLALPNAMYM